ncbi:septal ring lytic transglycosylase RlpA family protein [Bradyrhizobium sp. Pear77]|uniref:septal ring lytic transglycosylase RlpA family protein n=1 Tax=Bradyrhizobium altum TaxID=1571202 RepID=UPI00289FEEA3|nr:septal ring lytic transglycosylase RlpA family protein [Bradyrhizobium altum]MCC8952854.1 septal ring lytic transglycosylase RlpA family protein [Bradyrhizobium altum]
MTAVTWRNASHRLAFYSYAFGFLVRQIMRLLSRMITIATVPACLALHANPAVAQSFEDRWSIIPKAHAEPAPAPPDQTRKDEPQTQPPPTGQESASDPTPRSGKRSFNQVFTGKASFYSYGKRKTANGSPFNRDSLTAAHRSLPFGTRVRVTDLASKKSVVVRITDRGPFVPGRMLDLSLGAARSLGITDRGVVHVHAEVL